MKLYLVTRADDTFYTYDIYIGFVIAAENEQIARHTDPSGNPIDPNETYNYCWVTPDQVEVIEIGTTDKYTETTIICSDYKRG